MSIDQEPTLSNSNEDVPQESSESLVIRSAHEMELMLLARDMEIAKLTSNIAQSEMRYETIILELRKELKEAGARLAALDRGESSQPSAEIAVGTAVELAPAQLTEYKQQLQEVTERAEATEHMLEQARTRLKELEEMPVSKGAADAARLKDLEKKLAAKEDELARTSARFYDSEKRYVSLIQQLREDIRDATSRATAAKGKGGSIQLEPLRAELRKKEHELAERETLLAELQTKLDEEQKKAADSDSARLEMELTLAEKDLEVRRLTAELEQPRTPAGMGKLDKIAALEARLKALEASLAGASSDSIYAQDFGLAGAEEPGQPVRQTIGVRKASVVVAAAHEPSSRSDQKGRIRPQELDLDLSFSSFCALNEIAGSSTGAQHARQCCDKVLELAKSDRGGGLLFYGLEQVKLAHFLEAAANEVKEALPSARIFYSSFDQFLARFKNALFWMQPGQVAEDLAEWNLLFISGFCLEGMDSYWQKQLAEVLNSLLERQRGLVFCSNAYPFGLGEPLSDMNAVLANIAPIDLHPEPDKRSYQEKENNETTNSHQ